MSETASPDHGDLELSTPSAALRSAIVGAISSVGSIDPATIEDSTELSELGLDSLDISSVLVEVEDVIGDEIPAEILDRLSILHEGSTVADLFGALGPWSPSAGPEVR